MRGLLFSPLCTPDSLSRRYSLLNRSLISAGYRCMRLPLRGFGGAEPHAFQAGTLLTELPPRPPSYTSLNPQSRKNWSLSLGRLRDKWQSRNDSLSLTWNIFWGSKTHLVRAAFKRSVDLPSQAPVSLILKFFSTMGKPCLSLIQGQSVGSRLSFRVGSTVMTIRL